MPSMRNARYGTGSDVFQALAELEQFAAHILDDALQVRTLFVYLGRCCSSAST